MASTPQSIINIANSMFAPRSFESQETQNSNDDRLDAAHALLGVSPAFPGTFSSFQLHGNMELKQSNSQPAQSEKASTAPLRSRSNSTGLEALALLATEEQASMEPIDSTPVTQDSIHTVPNARILSSSSDEDSVAMPPPLPRPRVGRIRRRSVSNPEGMDKWVPNVESRLHFVLPASILEEELAEASAAMKAKEEESAGQKRGTNDGEGEEEEVLTEDELLRRARSRLLEDLSEGSLNGEKGVLTLPHSLEKYKYVGQRWPVFTFVQNIRSNFSHCKRYTARMGASEFTLQQKGQSLSRDFKARGHVEFGTRKYGTIVAKASLTGECE